MKEKTAKKGAIPFADKLAWSSCDGMGTLLAWNIFASYLTYYFTDVCGLAVGLAGNIILIAEVLRYSNGLSDWNSHRQMPIGKAANTEAGSKSEFCR